MDNQKQQTTEINLDDLPDFISWSHLDDGSAGLLPFVFSSLSILVFLGSVCLSCLTLNPLIVFVGSFAALMIYAVGAIVKALRLTQARQAYISALLEYYVINKGV